MLNNLKTRILQRLEKKNMKAEDLDRLLKRTEGYTLWMIENNDIRRFPFNDENTLASFLDVSTEEITKLNGRDAYEKNEEYITSLISSIHVDTKAFGSEGWESMPEKLSIYLRSCDMPGDVRDTEISRIEEEEYEIIPANHSTNTYYTAGPVYRKKIAPDFSVLVTKAYAEKIDTETYEITNPTLYGIYLTDSRGHLIDYIEIDSEYAFILKQYQSYLEISDLYDILHSEFDDEDYYSLV